MRSIFNRTIIIKLISISILVLTFGSLLFIGDSILLTVIRKKKFEANQRLKKELTNLKIFDSNSFSKINENNFGKYIKEGSLINDVESRGGHHDDNYHYLKTAEIKNGKIVWIFGDSWGDGLHKNEIKNNTIENSIKDNFSKLRIISTSSWSPLLMNIAFRHKTKIYNEVPDQVVIFLDQTDIGDDYCRYRPLVERDVNAKLLKIYPNKYEETNFLWTLNNSLRVKKSGIKYSLKYIFKKLYDNLNLNFSGITMCKYSDLLAWQIGNQNSPNGTPVINYEKYFKRTVKDFINELKEKNPDIGILLVTHDWAQHNINSSRKFKRNLSSLVNLISVENNVDKLHISNNLYSSLDLNLKETYEYPQDIFSHLKDYSILSNEIGKKLKYLLEK